MFVILSFPIHSILEYNFNIDRNKKEMENRDFEFLVISEYRNSFQIMKIR